MRTHLAMRKSSKDLPCKVITYGLEHDAQYQAADITYDKYGHASFTVMKDGKKAGSFYLKVPGSHNVSNALAAIALAQLLQIPDEVTVEGTWKLHRYRPPFPVQG